MIDERSFIARLEAAGPTELARILQRPTDEEERVLRAHLGDDRYQRMHGMALRKSMRAARPVAGNLVVLHGIMGSELTSFDRSGAAEHIWVKILRLIAGRLGLLHLSDDGRTELEGQHDVRATGILKRHYGEILLWLGENWNVRAFWYDWRKDLTLAADALAAQISGWFDDRSPVHLVAHSMGGLVARTFIKRHPRRWASMWDKEGKGSRGGRLVMLGTPNHGSFAILHVITGLEGTVRNLATVDLLHSRTDLLKILNSFVGSYQMLPSPLMMKNVEPLYKAETYGALNVPQRHLTNARKHHDALQDVVDGERMFYVAGYGKPTFSDIRDMQHIDKLDAYDITWDGDGRVPHALGLLKGVDTYYVEEEHGALPSNASVLTAIEGLLASGSTSALGKQAPASRARTRGALRETQREIERALEQDEKRLQDFAGRVRARGHTGAGGQAAVLEEADPAAREAEETLTRGFLGARLEAETAVRASLPPPEKVRFALGLVVGKIEDTNLLRIEGPPIDAVAVGHYVGVPPQAAELALDRAISRSIVSRSSPREGDVPTDALILTQYSERGILRGDLGQPFFLADPRPPGRRKKAGVSRVIAIAGLGVPGRFGTPELTVLARELCWSLSRLGKRHLASVLIGSGNGNLPPDAAVAAWVEGVRQALAGTDRAQRGALERITFVEIDPRRIGDIEKAILKEVNAASDQVDALSIEYKRWNQQRLKSLGPLIGGWNRKERWTAKKRTAPNGGELVATRVNLSLTGSTYRFGAITSDASVPEREIHLDPSLVMKANDELAEERDPWKQVERGQFLEGLLVPEDLRPQLSTGAPLVMLLDSTTARIHWEMVAQPSSTRSRENPSPGGSRPDPARSFLGTSRGFTRQLRTTFAPPPEPPPPPRRILRVLVVADPAEDMRLAGAEEEGIEVADLLESFNSVYGGEGSQVQVVRLFGPREATRTNVLSELMLHPYDVLHFAGHCVYDKDDPAASGWIFTGEKRLTAMELNRIDRIPKFVFSNACESGITPERIGQRSADMAPSFAEAFFARGVANFVCTAWPVDDAAAREFARTLYAGLIGLAAVDDMAGSTSDSKSGGKGATAEGGLRPRYGAAPPLPIHRAMQNARLAIAGKQNGIRTWGAYQHYGNPNFRLFERPSPRSRRGREKRRGR